MIPRELETARAEGVRVEGIELDLTGESMDVEVSELSPSGLPIATDGNGNFWIVDIRPQDTETAAVFFLCHDPPVFVYQSPTLRDFLQRPEVPEDRVFAVWRTNPGAIDHAAASDGDDDLQAFAAEAGERFSFVDLRAAEPGAGISWGRFGPRTEVRRRGHERLFAYAPPEKRPGLFRR